MAESKIGSALWIAKKFDHVNPHIHRYVFRFASGMNKEEAAKIICIQQIRE